MCSNSEEKNYCENIACDFYNLKCEKKIHKKPKKKMLLRNISRVLYSPKYLFWTNTATGVLFFGTGDLMVQKFIDKRSKIDTNRNG